LGFLGLAGVVRVYPKAAHLVIAEGPATYYPSVTLSEGLARVSLGRAVLRSYAPALRVVPLGQPRAIELPAPEGSIRFGLEPGDGAVGVVKPGVQRQGLKTGSAYAFESDVPLPFEEDGVVFDGQSGGIVVDNNEKTARLVLGRGGRIGYGRSVAWGCNGPYDVTFHRDHITGRTEGPGRLLYLTAPEGLDRLPMVVLDGQTYAPGTAGRTLIVPVLSGEHEFTIRALEQPPIWRNWQAWPDENER
jgi:hypothetical protein